MRTLSPTTATKLFVTGSTVGPIVDSVHNQCLLRYDVLPIAIEWPSQLHQFATESSPFLFASSWTVPPLLGIAYVVLGGLLPRLFEAAVLGKKLAPTSLESSEKPATQKSMQLRNRALLAVTTTAMVIKLSEYLETHSGDSGVFWLLMAALSQWAVLDGTLVALLAASLTSIGGPLSELPFLAHGVWEYLDSAADYMPLQNLPPGNPVLEWILNEDYSHLALSHITGPCYFAVALDAIALGRWFDDETEQS
jgi:hypothetical protein